MNAEENSVSIITTGVSDTAQSLRGYISVCCGQFKSMRKGNFDERKYAQSIKAMQEEFTRFTNELYAY